MRLDPSFSLAVSSCLFPVFPAKLKASLRECIPCSPAIHTQRCGACCILAQVFAAVCSCSRMCWIMMQDLWRKGDLHAPSWHTLAHLCAEERVHGSERLRAGERRFHSGEDLKIGAHLRIASRCLPAPQRQRGYFLQTVASFGFTLLAKFSASPRYSNCRRGKVLLPRADFICSGSRMSTSILPFAQYTV